MHYPVNVFVGKVRDYDGSRPSAIGKIQIDGELTLGDLGLEGDEQAEKKIHGGPDRALCHYPREHYAHWARELPQQADLFCAPAFGENLSTEGLTEKKCLYWRYLPLGRGADSGDAAAIAVLQA
ncbi:6-N-hydroxylaminopurine resistance protein [Klebsiella oxytoca]|nr:6-N-hydroxylaminopurine resistance protein [Klebsiella oxytoca]